MAVVVDRDRLVGRRAFALETSHLHVRRLVAPVTGADLRHGRGLGSTGGQAIVRGLAALHAAFRLRATGGRVLSRHGFRRSSIGVRFLSRHGFRRRAGGYLRGRIFPRNALRPFTEERDADDAKVIGPPGACCVGIRKGREIERSGGGAAFAPAVDVGALVRAHHVPGLRRRRGIAGNNIDTIDTHHRKHASRSRVAHPDSVLLAGRADNPVPSVLRVDRQRSPVRARHEVDAAQLSDRRGRRRG